VIFFSFSNLERLKEDAEWEDDTQSWKLPDLTRIKLPPASGKLGGWDFLENFHFLTGDYFGIRMR